MGGHQSHAQLKMRICPKCETLNEEAALARSQFRCVQCHFEMAYTDLNANGTLRGVIAYLKPPGELVNGRYRIRQILGRGGFGSTYLVQDLKLQGRNRALKEVPEHLFDEEEVKLLSRLCHPSIPDITDRFSMDGMVYLVLEFGGTRTLQSECSTRGGKISMDTLLPWINQLCEALIYLHSQHPPVIHRDLKPENILLDDNNRVMLIDFGIAKESTDLGGTRMLARAGSLCYSPPEQVLGTGTDERSDIYSLGATFFHLLTGQVPPPAHERVAGKVLSPPSTHTPGLPPALDELILAMMNLNLNMRPSTVKEVKSALSSLEGTSEGVIWEHSKTTAFNPLASIHSGIGSTRRPFTVATEARPYSNSSASSDRELPYGHKRNKWIIPSIAVLTLASIAGGVASYFLTSRAPQVPSGPGPQLTESPLQQDPPKHTHNFSEQSVGKEIPNSRAVPIPPPPQKKLESPLSGPKKEAAPIDLKKLQPEPFQEPLSILEQSKGFSAGSASSDPLTKSAQSEGSFKASSTPETPVEGQRQPAAPTLSAPTHPGAETVLSTRPSDPTAAQPTGVVRQPSPSTATPVSSAMETFNRIKAERALTEQPPQQEVVPRRPPPSRTSPPKTNNSGWSSWVIQ